MIPGKSLPGTGGYEPQRTCAYARVSTQHSAQIHSLENQTDYYERLIRGNPRYIFCGIYSDTGISGIREDRPGFLAMMEAARAGQMDLILTKSISRFARNTELLLRSVRELRSLGVGVLFEEQRINTLNAEGELLLTILASIAEEERKSVYKNIQWSIRAGYQRGKISDGIQRLYGFSKSVDGRIEIDPEQAAVIRHIYDLFLHGESVNYIAGLLNEKEVPRDSDQPWSGQYLRRILSNERYMGDCLLQKSYVADTGKQMRNKGEMDRYYVRDHHPAIISRDVWQAVQQRLQATAKKSYPFSSLLHCPHCGATLIRVTAEKKYINWKCGTYLHEGKAACQGISISEWIIQDYHEKSPITEPLIIKEDENAKGKKPRTPEHYHFIPLSRVTGT